MLRLIMFLLAGMAFVPLFSPQNISLIPQEEEEPEPILSYPKVKQVCEATRLRLAATRTEDSTIATAKSFLYRQLTQHIWPAWYGTDWDFNGISNTPGEGHIACGYFVSTTLKHAGFRLNRYRLAQQAASDICKALAPDMYRFSSLEDLEKHLQAQSGEQLYVLGLDYHVGFIQQKDSIYSFTHSSYYDPVQVTNEKFNASAALEYSSVYVLASLFEKDDLVKKWLSGSQVYP
jgi:hypothetical protein